MSEIFFPVYKDTFYTTSATTLDYSVSTDDDGVIFRGRAYKGSASEIAINISKIASDYLENKYNDAKSALTSNMVLWHHQNAFKYFYLYDGAGNLLNTYGVLFDFDNDFAGNSMILSDPIKPEISYQQVMPYSLYSRNGEIVKLYWETKDTYWNLISSAVTIPFQGGDTRILWETDYHPYRNWSVDIPGVSPFSYNSASEDGITVWVPAINTIADQTYNIYYIYNGTTFGYTVATQKGASFTFSPDPAVIGSFSGDSVNVSWYTQVTGATYTYETDGTLFDIVVNGNTATLTAKADNDTFSANTGWLKVYVNGELGGTLTVKQEAKYFNLLTEELLFIPDGETNNVGWSTNILPASLTVTTDDTGFTVSNITANGCSVTASALPDDNPRIGNLYVYSGSTLLGRVDLLQGESYLDQTYFTIKALSESDIVIQQKWSPGAQYRVNKGRWEYLSSIVAMDELAHKYLNQGDIMEVKYTFRPQQYEPRRSPLFVTGGKMKVYGNLLSLVYGDDFISPTSPFNPVIPNDVIYSMFDPKGIWLYPLNAYYYGLVDAKYLRIPAETAGSFYGMFRNCRSLTTAPKVLSTEAINYDEMFAGCTSLVTAPQMTITGDTSCVGMFSGCTSLVSGPPSLMPASSATVDYRNMFEGCVSLVNAPVISSYIDRVDFSSMFKGCTSLVNGPTIPYFKHYVEVSDDSLGACKYMFEDCTSLAAAPYAYGNDFTGESTYIGKGMFKGCTSIVNPPSGPCASPEMFSGCTSLISAPELLTTTSYAKGDQLSSAALPCESMFEGCTSLRTAPALTAKYIPGKSYKAMFKDCTSLVETQSALTGIISWENYVGMDTGENCYESMFEGCTSLVTAPALPATALEDECYKSMFKGCTSLREAPNLPAQSFENIKGYGVTGCYHNMFEGCTKLVTPPVFSVITGGTYSYMFKDCTSLVVAPTLPGVYADSAYSHMFEGCTKLTTVPNLPINRLGKSSCHSMFKGCTSLVNLPAEFLTSAVTAETSGCTEMFAGCTSLTKTPVIGSIKTMGIGSKACFAGMFSGCTNLTEITCLFNPYPLSSTDYIANWVAGVAPSGTFKKRSGVTWYGGPSGYPSGWTVEDYTP